MGTEADATRTGRSGLCKNVFRDRDYANQISLERKFDEQLGEREAEAGEHVFAVEGVGHTQAAVAFEGAVNDDVTLGGADDPREARAALKVVAQFFDEAERAVCRGDDFDGEIRCAAKKSLAGFRCARHSRGRDEAKVGTTQISRAHPAAEVRAADDTGAVLRGVRAHVRGERGTEASGVHARPSQAKLIVHQLAFAAVVRKPHPFFLSPSRGGGVPHAGERVRNAR